MRIDEKMKRKEKHELDKLNKNEREITDDLLRAAYMLVILLVGILVGYHMRMNVSAAVKTSINQPYQYPHSPNTGLQAEDPYMVESTPESPETEGSAPEAIEVIATTEAASEESSEAVATGEEEQENDEAWVSAGKFKITFYCACRKCSGKWGHRTSSGARCTQGVTAACAYFPAGTHVKIDGFGGRIIQDTGVTGRHIDVFYEDHDLCNRLGVQYREVWVKK